MNRNALTLSPITSGLSAQSELIMGTISSAGEQISAIGLGSSANFPQVVRSEEISALRGVLSTLSDMGGSVFDTAPGYGSSEEVSGQIAQELAASTWAQFFLKFIISHPAITAATPSTSRPPI